MRGKTTTVSILAAPLDGFVYGGSVWFEIQNQ